MGLLWWSALWTGYVFAEGKNKQNGVQENMGIEHSFKDEPDESKRCPKCGHVSTLKGGENMASYGLHVGLTGEYFYCQNPKCNVERIYGDNAVMVSGKNE